MRYILALLLALMAFPLEAKTLLSKTFYVAGVCDGRDYVPKEQMWTPWEPFPIKIVGIQFLIRATAKVGPQSYAFSGNSFSPDIMAWASFQPNGSLAGDVFYPTDLGFPLPAKAVGGNHHIDLHVYCTPAGIRWQAFYTVFYVTAD